MEAVPVGPKFRASVPLPTVFLFLFFQFPMYFVKLRWSLRVFIIDKMSSQHTFESESRAGVSREGKGVRGKGVRVSWVVGPGHQD